MRNPLSSVPDCSAFTTPHGSAVKVKYEGRFNGKHGIVIPVGTVNTQEIIEAYGPYTDMNYMLHRLKLGDRSVFSSKTPMFGDFSGAPRDAVDAVNMVHNAQRGFQQLSAEEKAKYNNDYRVWITQLFATPNSDPGDLDDPNSGNKDFSEVK